MSGALRIFTRIVAVAIPMAIGALAIGYSEELKQLPSAKEKTPAATLVRVMTLAPMQIKPRVVGHGTVEPAREWRAVARIDGEVVMTGDQLAAGNTVAGGTELLRLDDTDLNLSLAQIDAQLTALVVKDETLAASLDINNADLALSQAELKRQEDLTSRGVSTRAALDQSRRQELTARGKVVELENQLALNGAERTVLEAQRASARRNLEFTAVVAPYDVRLTDVAAELGQVVSRGQVMITAEGTEAVEIAAQFSIGQMRPLVRMMPGGTALDLMAKVRLPAGDHTVTWDARVVRAGEAIDARTQNTPLIVRVDNPLAQAEAGTRPPLRRNTFVEVVLSAPARQALVVPAEAVQGGKALVAAADNTFEPRDVTVAYTVDGVSVIEAGLSPGDKLVVTDPAIAVPGMSVKPVEDKATAARVAQAASGSADAASGAEKAASGSGKAATGTDNAAKPPAGSGKASGGSNKAAAGPDKAAAGADEAASGAGNAAGGSEKAK